MNRLLVFSGYNQRGVIALLRTAERLRVPYCIIATGKADTIFSTDYCSKVFLVREELSLDISYFEWIFQRVSAHYPEDNFVVAPSTESLNRLFLRHRELLTEYRITLPLVDEDLYSQISDKLTFSYLCEENGIFVPKQFRDLQECPDRFVAKPRYYYSQHTNQYLSPIIIDTKEKRQVFEEEYLEKDFFFQEFVEGESYYLLYYVYDGGYIDKFSQKNILQQSNGKSILFAQAARYHLDDISSIFEKLWYQLGFRGLIMVEMRRGIANDYMIEANPRIWGPSQLCVDAGNNLLHSFLKDWNLTSILPDFASLDYNAKYCWLGGIKDEIERGQKICGLSDQCMSSREFISFLENDVYCRKDTDYLFKIGK